MTIKNKTIVSSAVQEPWGYRGPFSNVPAIAGRWCAETMWEAKTHWTASQKFPSQEHLPPGLPG